MSAFFMAKIKNKTKAKRVPSQPSSEALPEEQVFSVDQVTDMVAQALQSEKKEHTLFDSRAEILNELDRNERQIEHMEESLHVAKIANKQLRSELSAINTAVRRQMEFDGE